MPPEIALSILKELSTKLEESRISDVYPSSSKISVFSPFIDLVSINQIIHIGPLSEFQSQVQIADKLSKEKEFVQPLDEAKLYDIWSLGITMYQLANGIFSLPYELSPGISFGPLEISSEFP